MRGIAEWLASIGLGEYTQRFAETGHRLSRKIVTRVLAEGALRCKRVVVCCKLQVVPRKGIKSGVKATKKYYPPALTICRSASRTARYRAVSSRHYRCPEYSLG
jgi:hypothetical protein